MKHAVIPSHPRGLLYAVYHDSSISKYSHKSWVCYEGGHVNPTYEIDTASGGCRGRTGVGGYLNRSYVYYASVSQQSDGATCDDREDEDDPYINPMGAKGIGEIGIVGTAVANAVYHATGIRIRDLPITLDKLLS